MHQADYSDILGILFRPFMQKKLPLVFIKGQSTDMTKLVSHRQCHLCGLFVGLNELAFLE